MQTYIALLRGINVGGHKKLKMADLKLLFEDLGFKNVTTYIQSGNVIFSSEEKTALATKISTEIESRFGWQVPVLIITKAALAEIIENCPFEDAKKIEAYFVLLDSEPKKELVAEVTKIEYPNEEFIISPTVIYCYYKNGIGKAKTTTNFFEKKLQLSATTRNYKTLSKLLSMAS